MQGSNGVLMVRDACKYWIAPQRIFPCQFPISSIMVANETDNKKWVILTSAVWLFCPMPKDSPRKSRGFFEVSTSRSLINLFGQSQTYLKNQKTRSRGRPPEESYIRSNAKIVIVFTSVRHRALKTRVKEHTKAIATWDGNSLLDKHHMWYNHQIDLMNVEIVDRSSPWRQRLVLEAWHSLRDTNAINEHIALPNVYNNIKNL